MSRLTYRSRVYRGAYAILFVGAYLLVAAYLLSGDESGSYSSTGVWKLLIGLMVACIIGAIVGPTLHRRLRGVTPRSRSRRSRGKHSPS